MKVTRIITTSALSGILSLSVAGAALATDSSVGSIAGTTGSDSVNKVTIENNSNVTTINTNSLDISSVNVQFAQTGNASATKNTAVSGSVSSGDAANNANTATTVTVDNTGTGGQGGGSITPPSGGSGSGGGLGGGSGSTTPGTGGGRGGGNVLGASTVGGLGGGFGSGAVATLPDTGASSPIDVSALRALYHQPTTTAPIDMAKTSGGVSAALLIGASLLSLMGAIGTTVFANRRARKLI